MLIPRMLFHWRLRGGTIPREEFVHRFKHSAGQWLELIHICVVNEEESVTVATPFENKDRMQQSDEPSGPINWFIWENCRQPAECWKAPRRCGPGLPNHDLGHVPDVEFQLDQTQCQDAKTWSGGRTIWNDDGNTAPCWTVPEIHSHSTFVCELLARGAVNSIRHRHGVDKSWM